LTGAAGCTTIKIMTAFEREIAVSAGRRGVFDVPEIVPAGKTSVCPVFPRPAKDAALNDCADSGDNGEDDGMDETAYLMSNPANRRYLLEAVDDAEHGRNLVSVPAGMFHAVETAPAA